jgi:hypothetical protein
MQISATWRPTQLKRNVQHKHPSLFSVHTKRNVQHKHPTVFSVHTKRNVQHKHPTVFSVHTKRNVQHKHPSVFSVHTKHRSLSAHMTLSLLVPCCSRSSDPHFLNTRRYLNALPTAQRTVHCALCTYSISNSNAPQNSVQRVALHGSAPLRTANSSSFCRRESHAVTPAAYVRDRTQHCSQFLLVVYTIR